MTTLDSLPGDMSLGAEQESLFEDNLSKLNRTLSTGEPTELSIASDAIDGVASDDTLHRDMLRFQEGSFLARGGSLVDGDTTTTHDPVNGERVMGDTTVFAIPATTSQGEATTLFLVRRSGSHTKTGSGLTLSLSPENPVAAQREAKTTGADSRQGAGWPASQVACRASAPSLRIKLPVRL